MNRIAHALAAITAAAWPLAQAQAQARNIPVEIHWTGAAPAEVTVDEPWGVQSLTPDDRARAFRGTLSVGHASERHVITVRYGNYIHPFDVRVRSDFPLVRITIDHSPQSSCTSNVVLQTNRDPNSLPEAINLEVNAGELLSISEPRGGCGGKLMFGALQARWRHNLWMSRNSSGLFLANPQFSDAYARARKNLVWQSGRKAVQASDRASSRNEKSDKEKNGLLSILRSIFPG